MDLAKLLSDIRALSVSVPALATILASVDNATRVKSSPVAKPPKSSRPEKVKRQVLSSRPLNTGKFPESGVNYAPRVEREPMPVLNRAERLASAERYRARVDALAEREAMAIEQMEATRVEGVELLHAALHWSTKHDGEVTRMLRRFTGEHKTDSLSSWHYLRAVASAIELMPDVDGRDEDNASKRAAGHLVRRYQYRKTDALKFWHRVCAYYFTYRSPATDYPYQVASVRRMYVGGVPLFRLRVQTGLSRVDGTLRAGTRAADAKPLPNRKAGWMRETQENAETKARRALHNQWRDLVRALGAAKVAGIAGAAELFASVSTMQLV